MNGRRSFQRTTAVLALWVAACSGGAQLPELPQLPGPPGEPMRAPGTVTDVYTRIAQGSRACWFGPEGALKATHIFHADLAPVSQGEVAEIAVHEFQKDAESRWGKRVFLVTLHPADGQTAIAVENIAMPDPIGSQMRADVFQWSQGGSGCTTLPPTLPAQQTLKPQLPQKPAQKTPSSPAQKPARTL